MHDILEGVAPDYLKNMFKNFFENNYLKIEVLNLRIRSFKYGKHFASTKPSAFRDSYFKTDSFSGQSSSQMMTLVLLLPLMICDYVDKFNLYWKTFMVLRDILLIVLAPYANSSLIQRLNLLVKEFLENYRSLTGKYLKPKHHHMTHYATVIKEIGPLRMYWCMTFESMHRFFKTAAINSSNFINVPKSVSYRYQLQKSFQNMQLYSVGLSNVNPFLKEEIGLTEFSNLCSKAGKNFIVDDVKIVHQVNFRGNLLTRKAFLFIKCSDEGFEFGKIDAIYSIKDEIFVLLNMYTGDYDKDLGAFELSRSSENFLFMSPGEAQYYLPLYSMKCNHRSRQDLDFLVVPCWIQ